MSISREQIEQRRDILQNDINTARQRIADYDKKKQEDVALLNALTGALQQCEFFLKELDNDKSEMAGDGSVEAPFTTFNGRCPLSVGAITVSAGDEIRIFFPSSLFISKSTPVKASANDIRTFANKLFPFLA